VTSLCAAQTACAHTYTLSLHDALPICFMPENEWDQPNYWLSVMMVKGNTRPIDIIKALEKENIESRPVWKPMHMQPFFESYDFIGGDVSEDLFEHGICLPSDTKMTENNLKKVTSLIKELRI